MIVYLNGEYVEKQDATLSVDDRGFLFADGVYEVVRLYGGKWFELDNHVRRLERSLREVRIDWPETDRVREIAVSLLEKNRLPGDDVRLYLQVTRGAAPRAHGFPPVDTPPTVYADVAKLTAHPEQIRDGMLAITVADDRWSRCDIKSVALLPNILAYQKAHDGGAHEAILIRDGLITEATHNSVFGVFEGTVRTAPLTNKILPGITRRVVLRICEELRIPLTERAIAEDEITEADEIFVAGTGSEVTPVVSVNQRPVGSGKPGPIARRIGEAFLSLTR